MSNVGEAFVTISPDLTGFDAKLSADLRSALASVNPNASVIGDRIGRDIGDGVRGAGSNLNANLSAALASVHPDVSHIGNQISGDIGNATARAGGTIDRNLAAALAGVHPNAIPIGQRISDDIGNAASRAGGTIDRNLTVALAGVSPNATPIGTRIADDIGAATGRAGNNIQAGLNTALVGVNPDVSGLGDQIANELGTAMIGARGEIERGLNTALVGVNPNTTALGSKLESEFGGSGRVGQAFATMGKAGALAFAGIGIAAGGAIGFGAKIASDNEQAQISFTTLLGSEEKASAFYKSLVDFAARTPFEIAGLRESAAQFLGAGVAADRVIPIMQAVGDATSAVGTGDEGIQRAVRALGQMQTKGKVTGEELLQLSEAGVPAMGALAASMGVGVAEAQDKVSKGQVSVNQLFDAIQTYQGPLANVKGLMDAQSHSLKGLLSTFKDVISQGFGKFGETVVPALKAQLPQVTTVIQGALAELAPTLAGVAGSVLETFSTLLPAITPVIGTIGRLFSTALNSLLPVITAVFNALAPFIDQLATALAPVFVSISEVLTGSLIPALVPVIAIIGRLLVAVSPLISKMLELGGRVIGALVVAFTPLLDVIVKVAEKVINALLPVFDQLEPVMGQVGKALADVAIALVPLIPAFGDLLVALVPLIPPMVQMLLIGAQFLPVLTPVIGLFARLLAAVVSLVSGPISLLTQGFAAIVLGAGQILGAVTGLLGPLTAPFTALGDVLVLASSGIAEFFRNVGTVLADLIGRDRKSVV